MGKALELFPCLAYEPNYFRVSHMNGKIHTGVWPLPRHEDVKKDTNTLDNMRAILDRVRQHQLTAERMAAAHVCAADQRPVTVSVRRRKNYV